MKKFIVITGPTATGKTAISVALAKQMSTEIISADSCQIYKGMDIGTAKITPSEMQGVKHHFVDIVSPNEEYSAALFQHQAFSIIENLNSKGKVPIIAGGTGLYVNSLVYELDFSNTCKDEVIRNKYNSIANEKGVDYIYRVLEKKDPNYADIIAKTDKRRIIRRLEILELGGDTEYNFRKPNTNYDILIIGLSMPREKLYERVNDRVDAMLKDGLEKEAKDMYNKYGKVVALKAIGYKELIGYFNGEYNFEEAVRLIKRNTRRFAKRQLTWFNRDIRIKWFDVTINKSIDDTIISISQHIKEKGF